MCEPGGPTFPQWLPLYKLHMGEATTVAELARECQLDTGAMTRLLDRLEAKGLCRRVPLDDRPARRQHRAHRRGAGRRCHPAVLARCRTNTWPASARRVAATPGLSAPHPRQRAGHSGPGGRRCKGMKVASSAPAGLLGAAMATVFVSHLRPLRLVVAHRFERAAGGFAAGNEWFRGVPACAESWLALPGALKMIAGNDGCSSAQGRFLAARTCSSSMTAKVC